MKNLALTWTTALALVLCLHSPTLAAPQVDWQQPISLSLSKANLVETLRSFATIGGAELVIDPEIEGQITVELDNVGWSSALSGICEVHDLACYWSPGAPPVLRVGNADVGFTGLAESISLALRDADLGQVLNAMNSIGGALDIADDIDGSVSFDLRSVPWPVALDHICRVGGCTVNWLASPPRIESAPSRRVGEPKIEVSTPTAEALEKLANSSALGPMAPLQLVVEGVLPAYTEVPIEVGPWTKSLDGLCEAAGCVWRLDYGEPSRLRISVIDERSEQAFSAGTEPTTANDLVDRLAQAAAVKAVVDPSLTLSKDLTIAKAHKTWRAVADVLCNSLGCQWRLTEDSLIMAPDRRSVAARPTRRSEPVSLGVTFETATQAKTQTASQRVANFTWAKPVQRLAIDGDRSLHLAWIPFENQVILPLVADCENGSVQWLDAIQIPLEAAEKRRLGSLGIELAPPSSSPAPDQQAAKSAVAAATNPTEPAAANPAGLANCIKSRPVTVRLEEIGSSAPSRTLLRLGQRPGDYLLITPPAGGDRPAAAVVRLDSLDGSPRVALLRPLADGSSNLEVFHLEEGQPLTSEIKHDGRSFRLEATAAR